MANRLEGRVVSSPNECFRTHMNYLNYLGLFWPEGPCKSDFHQRERVVPRRSSSFFLEQEPEHNAQNGSICQSFSASFWQLLSRTESLTELFFIFYITFHWPFTFQLLPQPHDSQRQRATNPTFSSSTLGAQIKPHAPCTPSPRNLISGDKMR